MNPHILARIKRFALALGVAIGVMLMVVGWARWADARRHLAHRPKALAHERKVALVTAGGGLALATVSWKLHRVLPAVAIKAPPALHSGLLDLCLFMWSDHNPCLARHLVNGGIVIFGRSGSGKTSASGKRIQRAITALPGSGGLLLVAMPSDLAGLQESLALAGRSDRLRVFGPRSPLRFNVPQHLLDSGSSTQDIATFLCTVGETIKNAGDGGGEHQTVWRPQEERFLFQGIQIMKWASPGRIDPTELERFMNGAAQTLEQLNDPAWQQGFHCQMLDRALQAPKPPHEQHDTDRALEFWLSQYPALADRTKTSVMFGVNQILHVLCSGVCRQLISGETNCRLEEMFDGYWWAVDMPPAEYGDAGLFVNGCLKLLTQKMILKRHVDSRSNLVCIWGDEAPLWTQSADSPFLAQVRQHLGCQVYLAQSLSSFHEKLGGSKKGEHQANAMLANFATKVVHSLGDTQTSEWASKLIGSAVQIEVGGSSVPNEQSYDLLMGRSSPQMNFHERVQPLVEAREFMTGLRTGGPPDFVCDSIVIRNGEPFANGSNWIRVAWSQK